MLAQRSRVCPHLGLMYDTATHMAFPSGENRCFNSKPIDSPTPAHQEGFCLRDAYEKCALYQGQRTRPMPAPIRAKRSMVGPVSRIVLVLVVLAIVVGGTFVVRTGWKDLLSNLLPPAGPATELVQIPVLASPSGAVTSVSTPETTPLSTGTPTLALISNVSTLPGETFTPSPSPHGFEVTKIPSGSNQAYLVHVVAIGETLDKIADRYNTTITAILAVNYKFKPPVLVQYPMVIPVGVDDPTGLPAFKVYVVEAYESISAEALAEVLGVDAGALELYNLCSDNCQFQKGDVLLVPHLEPENTE